jgi:hypothetical protein
MERRIRGLDRRKDGPSGAFKGNEDRSWIQSKNGRLISC